MDSMKNIFDMYACIHVVNCNTSIQCLNPTHGEKVRAHL